jgi:hypothetical protein
MPERHAAGKCPICPLIHSVPGADELNRNLDAEGDYYPTDAEASSVDSVTVDYPPRYTDSDRSYDLNAFSRDYGLREGEL